MSYRAGFVGLIGLPNSGKSTVMNAMVGEKVSIVTAKPQTTRRRSMGLVSSEDAQIVFVDAPGIVRASAGLNRFLREEAVDVIAQSDVLLAVLNIDERKFEDLDEVLAMVRESGKPWMALIHKTDLGSPHRVQILRTKLSDDKVAVIQGSALADPKGVKELILEHVEKMMPLAEKPLYDEELYTLSNTRDICAEIVREKCFEKLHQEVPFGLAVRILKFVEDEGDVIKVHAEILVSKDNHRPIVIGRGGEVLKAIGTEARKEMETLTGQRIFLDLNVASKKNWQRNPGMLKDLGYVVPRA